MNNLIKALKDIGEVDQKLAISAQKKEIAKKQLQLALAQKDKPAVQTARTAYLEATTESLDIFIAGAEDLDRAVEDLKKDPLQEAVDKGAEELQPKAE